MNIYDKIAADIKLEHGFTVKRCWISYVKKLNGLPMRQSSRLVSMDKQKDPCPDDKRPIIEASMRKLGLL